MRIALLLFLAALPAVCQPKKLVNAQLATHSAAAGLDAAIRPLLTAQPQPAWIAYIVPAARREGDFSSNGVVHLEPPTEMLVLYRVESGRIGKIRTLAPDTDIDAGGATVHWLNGVKPAESVAFLAALGTDSALSVIGQHSDPAAQATLKRYLAADQPEQMRLRVLNWFTDPETLAAVARNDSSPRVRGQALTVLARRAGANAAGPIQRAIDNDPDREVKRRAVSALQQIPDAGGVPLLIQLAKSSRDPEVRKQAMNSLGQSRDARAIAFFEEILKAKP